MTIKYAGIGSRQTPSGIRVLMTQLAEIFEDAGVVLRSGGANGADSAFEAGVKSAGNKEIFLPWKGFNNNTSGRYAVTEQAQRLAAMHHPAWHNCSQAARKLHGRNSHIVLGENLDDPVSFIICWTSDGKASGGTGQAIRIAESMDIPVFNLGSDEYVETDIQGWVQYAREVINDSTHQAAV